MKILFLPNWEVTYLSVDTDLILPPNKYVHNIPYWFFKHLPDSDLEVDVIDFQKKWMFHGAEKSILNFYTYQSLKAFFSDKKYDCVISHGAQSALFYDLLRTVFKRSRPKHIIIDVGCLNGGRENKLELFILGSILKRSQPALIYHSSSQEHYYTKHFPFLNRIFIPYGIDTEYFSPIKATEENYILSFGKIKRDNQTLIKAWKILKPDLMLKIVGLDNNSSLVSENIETLPVCSVKDLKNLIAGSIFVILPLPDLSYANGQTSVLQTMSMEKTVIVTKSLGIVDYLNDTEGSYFVKQNDPEDLALKIKYLLDHRNILLESNKKARQWVIRNFSEKDMAKSILQFITSA
jgi:glycosyltransferase involved in cell wall biosynthesis